MATLSSGGNLGINVPSVTAAFSTPQPLTTTPSTPSSNASLPSGAVTEKKSVIEFFKGQTTEKGPLSASLGDYYLTTDEKATQPGALGIAVNAYKKSETSTLPENPTMLYIEKVDLPAIPRVAIVLQRTSGAAIIGWLRRDTASFAQPMSSFASNRYPWPSNKYKPSDTTVNVAYANDSMLGFVMGYVIHKSSSGYNPTDRNTSANVVPVCTQADGNWQVGEPANSGTTACKASSLPLSYGFQLGNLGAEVEDSSGNIIDYSKVDSVNSNTKNQMYWGTFGSAAFLGTPAPAFWTDVTNRNPSATTTPAPASIIAADSELGLFPQWLMYGFPNTLNNSAEFTYTPEPV